MSAIPDDTPGLIRTPHLALALQGAHLLACQLPGGNPLFLSSSAAYAPGRSVRGGIPIIFPWFGDAPAASGLGAHGFARTSIWTLIDQSADGRSVSLELTDTEATRALWPHAFRLVARIQVGDTLEIELESTNTGDAPFEFESALHTYFAVTDTATTKLHGLEGATYLDKPDGFRPKTQGPDALQFSGEVDRVYSSNDATLRIEDRPAGRSLHISKRNAHTTIVWNPGPEKGCALSDLGPEWNRFVCVESANAGTDAIRLDPGAVHTLCATVRFD